MIKHHAFAISILALLLTACNASHKPGKAAFAKVIQQSHFDDKCELLNLPQPFKGQFPLTLELGIEPFDVSVSQAKFDALVTAGLLDVEEGTATRKQWNREVQIPARIYSLTGEGGKYLQAGAGQGWGTSQGLCLATYKVDEVKHFTQPSEMQGMGMTMTQVAYTYSPHTVSEWAKHDAVQAAFPAIKQKLAPAQSDSTMLVLTSDGWMDMKDLK